eukprot:m.55497 g.55497  ORF g.55497 m.55497 type:complete len:63 (+) comp11491_c0_seq1:115-303(+)
MALNHFTYNSNNSKKHAESIYLVAPLSPTQANQCRQMETQNPALISLNQSTAGWKRLRSEPF